MLIFVVPKHKKIYPFDGCCQHTTAHRALTERATHPFHFGQSSLVFLYDGLALLMAGKCVYICSQCFMLMFAICKTANIELNETRNERNEKQTNMIWYARVFVYYLFFNLFFLFFFYSILIPVDGWRSAFVEELRVLRNAMRARVYMRDCKWWGAPKYAFHWRATSNIILV